MPQRYGLISLDKPSCSLFLDLCPDFTVESELNPSDFMNKYWGLYQRNYHNTNSMNGAIFEILFSTLLINKQITPFFIQSTVAFVPNVRYDILLYTLEYGPVGISLKTSLRERYKQADLEAYVLKNVHRKSISFIVTANEKESKNVNQKIDDGELLALDRVFHIGCLDELFGFLSKLTFIDPPEIEVIKGRAITHNIYF